MITTAHRGGWPRAAGSVARRALVRSSVVSVALLAAGGAGVARAELNITTPTQGQYLRTAMPTFSGTTTDLADPLVGHFDPVTVEVFEGSVAGVKRVLTTLPMAEFAGPVWSVTPSESLPHSGNYTAEAVQGGQRSAPVTFTLDTTPPPVAITSPANGSTTSGELQSFTGTAGTDPGDLEEVRVALYAGSTVGAQAPLVTLIAKPHAGSWSVPGGLQAGTYTAVARQGDAAGNVGESAPIRFTVAIPASAAPHSTFNWYPPAPVVGQSVALVSGSTDAVSPLTGFAWDLAGNGPFKAAGPVLTTSFAKAGNHVVRLQVTDARGATSVAAETIPVSPRPLKLMQPFPIVRIGGVETTAGVSLSLFSVQAPVGARVSVICAGRGCRARAQSRIATASRRNRHARSVVLAFARFERSFRAGVTLEVRVSAPGLIGKFTSFAIHRRSLPTRSDECLSALDPTPIPCLA
jgi:hypothetical protein